MYIKVKVQTKAKIEAIVKLKEDSYLVKLCEPAEQNRANQRLLELFRGLYPQTRIRLVSGHHSPAKILSIDEEDIK